MTCAEARLLLLDAQRGQLPTESRGRLEAHEAACDACAREDAAERLLSEALEGRLPQRAAPIALKRRLAAEWSGPVSRAPTGWRRWRRALIPALAIAAGVLAAVPVYYLRGGPPASAQMVSEAVSDHLRILASQHPLDIQSGGIHRVTPWFEGRLDFAPIVRFEGDAEFPLEGGAIGYYLDRKAAVFVFHRRLHAISLLVFPAEGLPWASRDLRPIGAVGAQVGAARGFNAIVWREGELGYALVSDVDLPELVRLAERLAARS